MKILKYFKLILVALLINIGIATATGEPENQPVIMELIAIPTINNEAQKGATVELYCNGELIQTVENTKKKKVVLPLKKEAEYTVVI